MISSTFGPRPDAAPRTARRSRSRLPATNPTATSSTAATSHGRRRPARAGGATRRLYWSPIPTASSRCADQCSRPPNSNAESTAAPRNPATPARRAQEHRRGARRMARAAATARGIAAVRYTRGAIQRTSAGAHTDWCCTNRRKVRSAPSTRPVSRPVHSSRRAPSMGRAGVDWVMGESGRGPSSRGRREAGPAPRCPAPGCAPPADRARSRRGVRPGCRGSGCSAAPRS